MHNDFDIWNWGAGTTITTKIILKCVTSFETRKLLETGKILRSMRGKAYIPFNRLLVWNLDLEDPAREGPEGSEEHVTENYTRGNLCHTVTKDL